MGSVSSQAIAMLPATPQRTADSRRAAPAPITPPERTRAVDSGKPPCEAAGITAAPDPWAVKPWAASILMIRVPIVRMIRQPPVYVPAAMALAALMTTHVGISGLEAGRLPWATS